MVKTIRWIQFLRALGAGVLIRNPKLLEMEKKTFQATGPLHRRISSCTMAAHNIANKTTRNPKRILLVLIHSNYFHCTLSL
jgi:hypothetical protein